MYEFSLGAVIHFHCQVVSNVENDIFLTKPLSVDVCVGAQGHRCVWRPTLSVDVCVGARGHTCTWRLEVGVRRYFSLIAPHLISGDRVTDWLDCWPLCYLGSSGPHPQRQNCRHTAPRPAFIWASRWGPHVCAASPFPTQPQP